MIDLGVGKFETINDQIYIGSYKIDEIWKGGVKVYPTGEVGDWYNFIVDDSSIVVIDGTIHIFGNRYTNSTWTKNDYTIRVQQSKSHIVLQGSSWINAGTLPIRCSSSCSAIYYNGKIHIFRNASNTCYHYEYDKSHGWQAKDTLPNNYILIGSPFIYNNVLCLLASRYQSNIQVFYYVNNVWVMDETQGDTPVRQATQIVYDGQIHVFGAYNKNDTSYKTSHHVYNSSTKTWTRLANLPIEMVNRYSAVIWKNNIHFLPIDNATLSHLIRYFPSSNTIKEIPFVESYAIKNAYIDEVFNSRNRLSNSNLFIYNNEIHTIYNQTHIKYALSQTAVPLGLNIAGESVCIENGIIKKFYTIKASNNYTYNLVDKEWIKTDLQNPDEFTGVGIVYNYVFLHGVLTFVTRNGVYTFNDNIIKKIYDIRNDQPDLYSELSSSFSVPLSDSELHIFTSKSGRHYKWNGSEFVYIDRYHNGSSSSMSNSGQCYILNGEIFAMSATYFSIKTITIYKYVPNYNDNPDLFNIVQYTTFTHTSRFSNTGPHFFMIDGDIHYMNINQDRLHIKITGESYIDYTDRLPSEIQSGQTRIVFGQGDTAVLTKESSNSNGDCPIYTWNGSGWNPVEAYVCKNVDPDVNVRVQNVE